MSHATTLHFCSQPTTATPRITTREGWATGIRTQATDPVTPLDVTATKVTYHSYDPEHHDKCRPSTIVSRFPDGSLSFLVHLDVNGKFHGICKRYNGKKLLQVTTYDHGTVVTGKPFPGNYDTGYAWKQAHVIAKTKGLIPA